MVIANPTSRAETPIASGEEISAKPLKPLVEIRQFVPQKRLHLPKTWEDRAALGLRELRVPATWEEYLELSDACEYRIHYRDGHIISFIEIEENTGTIMGEASIPHETLVMRIGTLLSIALNTLRSPEFRVMGSNTKIFIAEDRKGFNADVTVVKGQPIVKEYLAGKQKRKGIVNPWLIVEILSNSTREFDLSEKLNDYKQIPGLQQIIFFEQGSLWASTYIRRGAKSWDNLDFTEKTDKIPVGDSFLEMEVVFANVFEEA